MSSLPLVSVITPCYNHGHYLSQAIGSVLTQTFTDWEAIIVDDGSTDNTREVAAQFADPRIRYIYQENRGLSAARNTGIRAAQGQYLAFLDADDLWWSPFLERCVGVLASQSVLTGVYTFNDHVDQNGMQLPQRGAEFVSSGDLHDRLLQGGFFPPCAVVVRKSVVQGIGLFDESLTSVEDWDFWLRLTANGGMMAPICEPLARYRVSAGSMSTNASRMHANRMAVLTKHFGPPQGDPTGWPQMKRLAYSYAHRSVALDYITQGQGEQGWEHFKQGVAIYPQLLLDLSTFYELACGDQPRGYRGEARLLNIDQNGAEMLHHLDALFASANTFLQTLKGRAYSNAHLAWAMLSERAGNWATARQHMRHVVKSYPMSLRSAATIRRLVKLHAGQKIVGVLHPSIRQVGVKTR